MSQFPILLNNAGTWTTICDESINILEELQNMFVRLIMHLPISMPKPVLTFDTGLLSMRYRIMAAKFNLSFFLCCCGADHLAIQVYSEQLLRGLGSCNHKRDTQHTKYDKEMSVVMWRKTVNDAVWLHNENVLKKTLLIIIGNYKISRLTILCGRTIFCPKALQIAERIWEWDLPWLK